jgi:hypothetical protein
LTAVERTGLQLSNCTLVFEATFSRLPEMPQKHGVAAGGPDCYSDDYKKWFIEETSD